jgi:hypothetical protein
MSHCNIVTVRTSGIRQRRTSNMRVTNSGSFLNWHFLCLRLPSAFDRRVSMTNIAQDSTSRSFAGVHNRNITEDLWPIMGILFGLLCTLAWNGFLVWIFYLLL